MESKKIRNTGLKILISILITCSNTSADEYKNLKFIDVNNPFINRIPVSVPDFVPVEENDALNPILSESNSYLQKLLRFTSYFKVKDDVPKLAGVVSTRIEFEKWKKLDSELLITCGVYCNGSILEMEFRLFDIVKEQLLTGKRYKGRMQDHKKMAKRFASEVMETLFKNKGLFDSKIAFVSNSTGNKEIYICDFDGTGVVKATDDKSIAISPSWSYDNKWLAFTSYKRKIPEIFVKPVNGGRGYIISKGRLNITPSWVPGKFSMAAVFNLNGDPDIYLISGKGDILKRVVKGWGIDVSPCFSPNGEKMLFVSRRGGNPQIYIKDMKSSGIKRLTFEGNYNTSPSWSPTGEFIAYVGMTKEDGINIYIIKPDGSDLRQLTTQSGDNEDPTWSPDGSLIAFASSRSGGNKIYVMTRSGDDQRLLIGNLAGEQTDPAWSH